MDGIKNGNEKKKKKKLKTHEYYKFEKTKKSTN